MNKNEIKNKIKRAYKILLKNDSYLLIVGVNERSLTHKFAEYLQLEFPEYNVDCEYNKNIDNPKTIPVWEEKKKELISELKNQHITKKREEKIIKILDGEISVYPDMIIHHRGTVDNFAVIEAKKSTNKDRGDSEKLISYKNSLDYKYAIAIKFLVGSDYKDYRDTDLEELIDLK